MGVVKKIFWFLYPPLVCQSVSLLFLILHFLPLLPLPSLNSSFFFFPPPPPPPPTKASHWHATQCTHTGICGCIYLKAVRRMCQPRGSHALFSISPWYQGGGLSLISMVFVTAGGPPKKLVDIWMVWMDSSVGILLILRNLSLLRGTGQIIWTSYKGLHFITYTFLHTILCPLLGPTHFQYKMASPCKLSYLSHLPLQDCELFALKERVGLVGLFVNTYLQWNLQIWIIKRMALGHPPYREVVLSSGVMPWMN